MTRRRHGPRHSVVPKEFVTVYDFKKPKKTPNNKRALPVSKLINFPVRRMCKRSIIYDENNLKIIHNDCGKELDNVPANSADVAVTSPPYNIGIAYNSYDDNKTQKEYLSWLEGLSKKIYKVLKEDGSFFLNVGGTSKDPGIPNRVCSAIEKAGFVLQNHIVWVKSISIFHERPSDEFKNMLKTLNLSVKDLEGLNPDLDLEALNGNAEIEGCWRTHGHFKPINSKRFVNNLHEEVFHFTKSGNTTIDRLSIGVPYEHKSNMKRWKHNEENDGTVRDCRCKGNVWHIPYKTVTSAKDHPAGYPSQLAEECIRLHGVTESMVVIDPFLGAGSTLLACQELGIRGVGIEIDKAYCCIARDKLLCFAE